YSYQTGKAYVSVVKGFKKSGKTPREFLLSYSNKSRPIMRGAYFALKFFYKNCLMRNLMRSYHWLRRV
ncbi:MAG: hypothetical protein DRJ41_00005, partial [Thermoprotei archaeon]